METKLKELRTKIFEIMDSRYNKDFREKYINGSNEEQRHILKISNLLLKNIFLFDEEWDMEACRIPYKNIKLEWNYTPNGDEEWTFMLNRHEYLNSLILAYYITDDFKYIEKTKFFILDWINKNNLDDDIINTKRAIDTGIRINSWANVLLHLVYLNFISDNELKVVIKSIENQIIYMKSIYKEKYILSNWGVLQTGAILNNYIIFGDFFESDLCEVWAKEELIKQVNIQIFSDGSHWEQSPMYHVEVLNVLIKHLNILNMFALDDYANFKSAIEKMGTYLMHSMTPKGDFEAQCDSDRSFIKDVVEKVCILSFNGIFKKILLSDNLSLSTIYSMGKYGQNVFGKIKYQDEVPDSKSFVDSGNIYIRDDFSKSSNFTLIKSGTIGSGHGHSDIGHISLFYKGEPILVDSGRYTYLEEDKLREYFKSAYAHNVCIVDDKPFGVSKGAWGSDYYSDCLKNYYVQKENIHYAEVGFISDYADDYCSCIKKIIYIESGIWLVMSDIRYKGVHEIKNYYNFDSLVSLNKENYSIVASVNSINLKLNFYNIDNYYIKESLISSKYNEITNTKKVITKKKFKDRIQSFDIILESENYLDIIDAKVRVCDSERYLSGKDCIAKKIIVSEKENYTIIVFNKEIYSGGKLHLCDGVPVYGKVFVIHEKDGIRKSVNLRG